MFDSLSINKKAAATVVTDHLSQLRQWSMNPEVVKKLYLKSVNTWKTKLGTKANPVKFSHLCACLGTQPACVSLYLRGATDLISGNILITASIFWIASSSRLKLLWIQVIGRLFIFTTSKLHIENWMRTLK